MEFISIAEPVIIPVAVIGLAAQAGDIPQFPGIRQAVAIAVGEAGLKLVAADVHRRAVTRGALADSAPTPSRGISFEVAFVDDALEDAAPMSYTPLVTSTVSPLMEASTAD